MKGRDRNLRIGWICLLAVGIGILAFGLIAVMAPGSSDEGLLRANGLAAIGLGLFGSVIAVVPFRRGEPWAWMTLWFYPLFWTVHLAEDLPPGRIMSIGWCSSCCRSRGS